MKKIIISLVLCLFINTSVYAIENTPHFLSVKGVAVKTVQSDTAVITLGVETTAKKVVDASNINAQSAKKVIESVKILIKQGDSVKTQSYRVSPRYEYDKASSKNILIGYTVTNEITIKTKNLSGVGNIIDTAISHGANNVQNVFFTVENDENIKNTLLSAAVKNAKATANVLATELNQKIVGVARVNSYFSQNNPQPMVFGKVMAMERADFASTPIESGDMKIQADVDVDFIIE